MNLTWGSEAVGNTKWDMDMFRVPQMYFDANITCTCGLVTVYNTMWSLDVFGDPSTGHLD